MAEEFFHYSLPASLTTLWIFILIFGFSAADIYTNNFAVHIVGGYDVADQIAINSGFINIGQIGSLEDHYLFEAPTREKRSTSSSIEHHEALKNHEQVMWFEQQVAKSRRKRDFHPREITKPMSILDPIWSSQWYLNEGGWGSYDMNVLGAWQKGYTGKNIVVSILDDGLEWNHPDLIRNYDPLASHDVNDHDSDPTPKYDPSNENKHGTRCAGEVSAEANNTICSVGIAPDSKIGGIRMLDGTITDAVEAESLSFRPNHIDIYSASWGPDDDGRALDGPGRLAQKAFLSGIIHGRGGKGSIFVWASGNGGPDEDSCNCDGYANSMYTLSVSSTSEKGQKPWYLEECSSTLATTYSSGSYVEKKIATTDLHHNCTMEHTGTSASAPLAAGIIALVLEANYNLTWRDVQYITLMTARTAPFQDGSWITNGVGRKVSLQYGYGLMDASAMIDLALVWRNVPQKHECQVLTAAYQLPLKARANLVTYVTTNGCQGGPNEVNFLEHVQAVISLTYPRRGDVTIFLTSPMGTRSQLLPRRPADDSLKGFNNWPFMSVHFWGENPHGKWTLEIETAKNSENNKGGKLDSWLLLLHGTKRQPVRLKNESSVEETEEQTESCHIECSGTCTGPGASNCSACKNYLVVPTSTCVAECPKGFYKEDKKCLPCVRNCASCMGPLDIQCHSCLAGNFLKESNSSNGSCLPCHTSCKECSNNETFCTVCTEDHILQGGICWPLTPATITKNLLLLIGLIICLGIFTVIFFIMVVVYAYRNNHLHCWEVRSFYKKVPECDSEAQSMLDTDDSD